MTNESKYHEQAERTLEILAGSAGQYGIFAATYGIAAVHFSQPHSQIVIIGEDKLAGEFYTLAVRPFGFGKTVIRLTHSQAVAQNLPPALAETIPKLPALKEGKTMAVICRGFTCLPPITDIEEFKKIKADA